MVHWEDENQTKESPEGLHHTGQVVGGDQGADTEAEGQAPIGVSPSEGAGPGRDECDIFRTEDGMPMERAEQDRDLFIKFSAPTISGMGEERSVQENLAAQP